MILTHLFRSLKVAAAALVVAAMSACTEPAGEIQEPSVATRPGNNNGPTYRAGFYLTVGEVASETASRATPSGEYNPGEGIENYIDLDNGNIRVFLYTTSNKFLSELNELTITPVETYESSKLYFINGSTQADISSGNFKIMVVANWPEDLPEQPAMEDVFATRFNFNGTMPSKDNPIPLYGISQVALGELRPDNAYNIGKIHLIRALAKIELIVDDAVAARLTPSKVQLTRYNKQGFCAPAVKSQSDYVQNSWGFDYLAHPYIPSPVEQGLNLDFATIEEGKRYLLYVPEFSNSGLADESLRSRICINFKESLLEDRYFDIIDNSTSIPVIADLKRNVWYRIRLKSVNENVEPTMEVDVIPYKIIDLDPIFGIDK